MFTASVAVNIATWLRLRLAVNVATALADLVEYHANGGLNLELDDNRQSQMDITAVPAHHSQGPSFPGSAIPTVGHWGGLGLGLGVRVRRTVGMADPGNGGPWEWRTGIITAVNIKII